MTVIPNGTDAKDIALHFLNATGVTRMTPAIVSQNIGRAKHLLGSGYSKEEVISVIDHIVASGVEMYSIGYVSSAINDVLREMKKSDDAKKGKLIAEQMEVHNAKQRGVVEKDDERAERNARKARRTGVQSRLREKFDFDMFEE